MLFFYFLSFFYCMPENLLTSIYAVFNSFLIYIKAMKNLTIYFLSCSYLSLNGKSCYADSRFFDGEKIHHGCLYWREQIGLT